MEDLIDFDIIETHKENIQSLPGGRSAKALAATFAPTYLVSTTPTPSDTRNLHDAVRQDYELEIIAISDSDDPLDIYDRYVKWTLTAYPSAQATAESQLRPLLERATKAFQTAIHYKNDPRYLKFWLTYIRFFSDAPKETFAYLARHNIGEGLALFYEEFAAWLEGAGRWIQADEVYRLGIEREARPTERLVRKFGEFQHRFESRTHEADGPSSPALPTVRPALMAKLDPFALSTPRAADPQAQRLGVGGSSTPRGGNQKIAIFTDAGVPASCDRAGLSGTSKGWENIGSLAERKKENTVEARAWTGETLKMGKRTGAAPKMMIFKDQSTLQTSEKQAEPVNLSERQEIRNNKTGKIERVFVNLEVVYPNPNDPNEEMSFEELRARSRGWTSRDWAAEKTLDDIDIPIFHTDTANIDINALNLSVDGTLTSGEEDRSTATKCAEGLMLEVSEEANRVSRTGRIKKMKVMEVKVETQTVKTNLESPTGPKLKRKNSTEPTMTLHTKAATNDILDIFNQPLGHIGLISNQAESADESDYEDDDYLSAGESTGTGRISGTSEFADDETDHEGAPNPDPTDTGTESQWSEFSISKHVSKLDLDGIADRGSRGNHNEYETTLDNDNKARTQKQYEDSVALVTPTLPESTDEPARTNFIPLPPVDYEPPNRPYRDPSQAYQNRLPFMTPIVEKTESSMGALTILKDKDYFNSKSPSKDNGDGMLTLVSVDEQLSTPFREIVNEAKRQPLKPLKPLCRVPPTIAESTSGPCVSKLAGPIIQDTQCNPIDDCLRNTILESLQPPLSSYVGFLDHRPQLFNKAPEIRKFIRTRSKGGNDKTTTSLSLPPTLTFSPDISESYVVRRELGKGAFAPVYLAEREEEDDGEQHSMDPAGRLFALKCEHPPTPWEFYIMSTLHSRLAELPTTGQAVSSSILTPYALHIFADEGYLLEQYLDQGTLLDLVNLAKLTPAGVLDEAVAMFLTVELLRAVEAMHAIGILHGDLKADNCLVRLTPPSPTLSASSSASADTWDAEYQPDGSGGWASKGLCLIDFGRGIDLRQFRPEVQFIADWKTDKDDCAEMREMRPWTWQVDYWGVAGVAHNLLFGKFIEDIAFDDPAPVLAEDSAFLPSESDSQRTDDPITIPTTTTMGGGTFSSRKKWKLREPFKRYWQTQLWAPLFDLLLNSTAHAAAQAANGAAGGGSGGSGGSGGGGSVGSGSTHDAAVHLPLTAQLTKCRREMEDWLYRESARRGLKTCLRRLEEKIGRERGR